jgi:hypothetical protein
MPGWLGIAVPLVLSVAVSTVLAGARLSVWRLSIAVGLSQVLFHTLFVLGAPSPRTSPHHHAHGAVTLAPSDAVAAVESHPHSAVWMWIMHGVAVLATVAVLAFGERAAHTLREVAITLFEWVRRCIPRVVVVSPGSGPNLSPVAATPPRPKRSPLVHSVTRRGPPAAFAF